MTERLVVTEIFNANQYCSGQRGESKSLLDMFLVNLCHSNLCQKMAAILNDRDMIVAAYLGIIQLGERVRCDVVRLNGKHLTCNVRIPHAFEWQKKHS